MTHQIEWAPSRNFRTGRGGHKPIAIVSHITAGQFPGCMNWLQSPQAKASSTYIVTRTGKIIQLVKDEDTHWANGGVAKPNWPLLKPGVSPNYYTLSIEHEGYYVKDKVTKKIIANHGGDGELTEAQYQATLWLHKHLCQKWGIPVTRDTIIGHYRIDSVNRPNCPGPKFPWDRLFADLANKPKIKVNGQVLEGIIVDDRTYAPVRSFGEAIGKEVVWDPQKGVTVGGVKIDVKIIGDRSYAPVRYLAEALGRQVSWDEKSKTVVIV